MRAGRRRRLCGGAFPGTRTRAGPPPAGINLVLLLYTAALPETCPHPEGKPVSLRHWCRAPPDPGFGKRTGAEEAAPPCAAASDNRWTFSCTAALPPSRAGPDARRRDARQAVVPPRLRLPLPCPDTHARCRIPGLRTVPGPPGPHPSGQAVHTGPLRDDDKIKKRLEE